MDTKEAILYCISNKIRGSYVECGVLKGIQPILACNTILQSIESNISKRCENNLTGREVGTEISDINNFIIKDIYMYDTYQGMTKPGKYDYTTETGLYQMNKIQVFDHWSNEKIDKNINNWCYCSLEEVKKKVYKTKYPKNKLHFIKGDVMETLTKSIPNEISILRLDTDWYASSKFELEQLYKNVVDGGVIILDDYFHWDGQRRATDEFLNEKKIKIKIYKNKNGKTGFFFKGHYKPNVIDFLDL